MALRALGNFIVYEEISSGGAAVIYRAKNKITGKQIALKVLHPHLSKQPEYKKRIQREVKFISNIDHPNLVKIYSSGEIDGSAYIEMEFFKSKTLEEEIRNTKDLKLSDFYRIAVQIAEGLSALHKKNILHRDLSFGNILINDKKEVKITDFGLIKILPENTQFSKITQLTAAGNTFGTIYFMSPEQLDGQDISKESDIFSYGVNLYYMLTGKLPFSGKTGGAVINAITSKEPDSIIQHNKTVSFDLQSLVLNLLCKKPENRIKDIHQISRMLSLFAEKENASIKHRIFNFKPWLIAGGGTAVALFIWLILIGEKADNSVADSSDPSGEISQILSSGKSAIIDDRSSSASLEEFLQYNFRGYKINFLKVRGFNEAEEKKIRYEFARAITLIKGKDIYFKNSNTNKQSDNLCEIKYTLIKNESSLYLNEEWSSEYINGVYQNEQKIYVKGDKWLTSARKLFLNSALIKNSKLMLEGE